MVPVEIRAGGRRDDGVITAMTPSATFHGFDVTAGGDPVEAMRAGRLVMAESVARKLSVGVGDTVRIETPYADEVAEYRVGAISDETLGGPVFASADVGRELWAPGNEYNVMYLYVDPDRAEEIEEDLYDLPGATQVQVKARFVDTMTSYLELHDTYGGILLAFGFAMAAAVIYNTFTANILERTREIATMRTIGEDNARLAAMVTIENVFLALAAVPLGVWLGIEAAGRDVRVVLHRGVLVQGGHLRLVVAWIVVINLIVLLLSEIPPIRRIFRHGPRRGDEGDGVSLRRS